MRFMPTKTDRARLNQRYRMEEKAAFVEHIKQNIRQTRRVIRSGYAFSQQSGWGPLITSGRMKSKATSRVRPSNIPTVSSKRNFFHIELLLYKENLSNEQKTMIVLKEKNDR